VETKKLSDEAVETLKSAIGDLKRQFQTTSGEPIGRERAEALDKAQQGQEKVTRVRPQPEKRG
jgi:hypothetical protein